MISNEQIARFRNLDLQAIEGIADEKLRKQALQLKNKQGGFTLLELLVVVAILAVLGGLAIGAYGDKTTQAAKGSATNTIAAVDGMVRSFQATAKMLPSNLDTLVCADATGAMTLANTRDYGGDSDMPSVSGGMSKKINDKLQPVIFTTATGTDAVDALQAAGIGILRYGAHTATDSSCDDLGSASFAFNGGFYPSSPLSLADIPNRGFDIPVNSSLTDTKNRGRGFEKTLDGSVVANDIVLQVWKPGTGVTYGSNNIKVGAKKNDVLAVLGLGNNSTMITDQANRVSASAPFYGADAKDKYGRYLALVKVGTITDTQAAVEALHNTGDITTGFSPLSKATFITVVDTRGDFLDEEYAEANGQKL